MNWQTLIRSKYSTWFLVLIILAVGFLAGKMYLQKKQIDDEINKLKTQADEISQTNQELTGLIKYLKTPEFQEQEAREKLNLKKEGEFVVVLPNNQNGLLSTDIINSSQSNSTKWFNYFFNNVK